MIHGRPLGVAFGVSGAMWPQTVTDTTTMTCARRWCSCRSRVASSFLDRSTISAWETPTWWDHSSSPLDGRVSHCRAVSRRKRFVPFKCSGSRLRCFAFGASIASSRAVLSTPVASRAKGKTLSKLEANAGEHPRSRCAPPPLVFGSGQLPRFPLRATPLSERHCCVRM